MMHGWNPFMAYGSAWGIVWMLLLVALTVWAAIVITRALLPRSERGDRARQDEALEVLRARYARGEIDDEEYRARRDTLTTRRDTLTTSSGGRS